MHERFHSPRPPEMTLKQCCGGCWTYWWSYRLLRHNEKESDFLRCKFLLLGERKQLLQYMLRQEEELSREMEFCLKSLEGDDANLEEAMEWKEVLDVHTGKCDLSEETVVFSLNYSSLT
ncbi:unnamed protein product [Brassica oleracea]